MKKYLLLLLFLLPGIASAQSAAGPRIDVSDIYFGTLGIGVFKTMPMRICNIGSDTLRFVRGGAGNDFIEWLRHRTAFTITQGEIDRLAAARLVGPDGPNSCIDIMVTFQAESEGFYRDSAQLFAGTRDRKDYSIWTANVAAPDVRLTDLDWGERWVVRPLNQCTKDSATRYRATVEVWNEGSSDAMVESIVIVGPDSDAFALDNSDPNTTVYPSEVLRAGSPQRARQALHFMPREERVYSASLVLMTIDPLTGARDTLFSMLSGVGIESHIALNDHHFGMVEAGATPSGTVALHALPTRPTRITDIRLEDPTHFRIANTGLPTENDPWILPPGTSRIIEVEFRPQAGGPQSTRLRVSGDFSLCDDSTALLTANMTSGIAEEHALAGARILRVDRSGNITLRLDRAGVVSVEIFNAAGERVHLIREERGAGEGVIAFDRPGLAAGHYYIRLTSRGWSAVERFVVE